jgi:hypothetical protein
MARDGIGLMHIFVIDAENRITAHPGTRPVRLPKDGCKFADAKELAGLIAGWPLARSVEIWNKLPNAKKVSRFADRKIAAKRIWGAVQQLRPAHTKQRGTPGGGKSPAKTNPARDGTKTERIIALLKRPSGATINDIVAEMGWQPHSVRGFISGQLAKRLGFRIKSFKVRGERVYRIMEGKTT